MVSYTCICSECLARWGALVGGRLVSQEIGGNGQVRCGVQRSNVACNPLLGRSLLHAKRTS